MKASNDGGTDKSDLDCEAESEEAGSVRALFFCVLCTVVFVLALASQVPFVS